MGFEKYLEFGQKIVIRKIKKVYVKENLYWVQLNKLKCVE